MFLCGFFQLFWFGLLVVLCFFFFIGKVQMKPSWSAWRTVAFSLPTRGYIPHCTTSYLNMSSHGPFIINIMQNWQYFRCFDSYTEQDTGKNSLHATLERGKDEKMWKMLSCTKSASHRLESNQVERRTQKSIIILSAGQDPVMPSSAHPQTHKPENAYLFDVCSICLT